MSKSRVEVGAVRFSLHSTASSWPRTVTHGSKENQDNPRGSKRRSQGGSDFIALDDFQPDFRRRVPGPD